MPRIDAVPRAFPRLGEFGVLRTALVVIDMQHDFLSPGGKADRGRADLAVLRSCVPGVARLLEMARACGMKIAHTREGYAADLSDLPPWRRASHAPGQANVGDAGPLGRALVRGEPCWEIIDEAKALPGEPVFDKNSYGAFAMTRLEEQLRAWSVDCLLLAGVTTECCVTSTLREALDRGFDCLVEDCVASRDPHAHELALGLIRRPTAIFGQAAPLDALLPHLKAS